MNENFQKLPPELQARINSIVNQAASQGNVPAAQAPGPTQAAGMPPQQMQPAQPPAPRPPSLMDHVVALRQEVAELRNQVAAIGQVTEAVGNAVGELYQMFQSQTTPSTYSSAFEAQQPQVEDEGY